MSRLTNYLIELKEIRSEQLTEQEATDMINKKCSIILDKYKRHPDNKIYRGLRISPNYQFTNPAKGAPRYSKGKVGNYYTLLMDNLPNWKAYPKRSRSIICTNTFGDAATYGDVYVVFPFNNAKFGVAPESDIWLSFKPNINNLRTFVIDLKDMLNATTHGVANFDKDWNRLTKSFKQSEERIKNNMIDSITLNKFKQSIKKWVVDVANGKTYINTFMNYMSPSKNGFLLTKDPMSSPKRRELWTDSKCVLVYEQLANQLMGVEDYDPL